MAGELVGGALLSAFLQVAFDRLASRDVLDYFRAKRLNDSLLEKLNISLLSINAVMDDAEDKQIINPHVKAWLDKVKDAVFDAEDVLDEIETEISKRKLQETESRTNTSKVWNFFTTSVSLFDKEIESRMKEVHEKLEYLASKKDILGLKEGSGVGAGLGRKQRLLTTSLVDEAKIYGRHDERKTIMDWLLSGSENGNHLSVISIVGMGGLGKTTLAQLVYNDQKMKGEFDLKAWVCVSEEFDVFRVTKTILEAITLCSDDTKDINMLQVKLKENLTGKKFFLVLDDVWNENHMQWEAMQTPFIYGAPGSKIIVTTRSDKVASAMRSVKKYQLQQLTEEDSWLLFSRYAFHEGDTHLNADLEDIGRKIIKKCKGLPLALKTIGSLLYTKTTFVEWNIILKSEIWDMPDDENNILPALRLSYHYLPSPLKRCFGYCSLFPKDYEFDREHLVRLWMAENFLLCSQQNKSTKDVGKQFFDDLLSRSFFQRSSGGTTRFVMHDLVNDLAKYVYGEFCFRLEVEEVQAVSNITRHFSYLRKGQEASRRFDGIYTASKLRTFLPLSMNRKLSKGYYARWMPSKLINDLLSKLKYLRVLSLSGYFNITELPDSIGNQKHLRYLDLSGTRVKALPDSICLLYNLQTLKLRHCKRLEELPSDLYKLVNLRHLDFLGSPLKKLPKRLGELKNLQVLSSFHVGQCSESNIQQLGDLNLWGTLSILELQNVTHPSDALAANLRNKLHLENLTLGWSMNDDSQKERDVLEKLQPAKNLKELSIRCYGGTIFPNWFAYLNSLSNLMSLELANCKYCLSLPPLGILPSLKTLTIAGLDSMEIIGAEFYGNSSSIPFGSLETLKFERMVGWERWEIKNATRAFPHLKELDITYCPKLKDHLPEQLPSLRKQVIVECEQLVASVPRATAIDELCVGDCGKLQMEYLPTTLKTLKIVGRCMEASLVRIIEETIVNTSIEKLKVYGFANMEFPMRRCHDFLLRVRIEKSCDSLKAFPMDFFPKLQRLVLMKCSNLEMLCMTEGHDHNLASLTRLQLSSCPKFVSFPKGGFSAPKLEFCWIEDMENLKSLPERMDIIFPSLIQLVLLDCPQLESFPEGGLPSNMEFLQIHNCPKLLAPRMKWGLHTHTSLLSLRIQDANVESFPDQELLPTTLRNLSLLKCSNLRKLDYDGLCHLSSPNELSLKDCPLLSCLPEEGLPSSLRTLRIKNCPLLKQRCQDKKGQDWGKIAHIPTVIIDDVIIRG